MKSESVSKNYIYNLFSQSISFIFPLVVIPYISRIFMAEGIGINSYTTANVTYFTLFSMTGISGYGQRQVAICRDDRRSVSRLFCELQAIHFLTFLLTGIVFVVMILNSKMYWKYYMVHFITLIACFLDIAWFYQAYEKFRFIAVRNCIIKFLTMIATFLLVKVKEDLIVYIAITAIGTLLSNLSLWVGIKRYIDFLPFKELCLRQHVKGISVFFIPTIAASLYSILDKSVINWITHKDAENGYYEQAYKALAIANVLVQAYANVLAPRMSHIFAKGNMDEFRERLNKALCFMLFLAIPTALGMVLTAPRFVDVFFGTGYNKTVNIMYIFAPLVIVLGFSVYLDGLYLVPIGKRMQSASAICIGAVLNVFLNIVLVIKYESEGAAVATVITEMIISFIMIYLSRCVVEWKKIGASFLKYLFASLLMMAVILIVNNRSSSNLICLIVEICLGGIAYLIVLLFFRDSFILNGIRKIKRVFLE